MLPGLTLVVILILTLKVKAYLDENNLKFKKESTSLDKVIALLEMFVICVMPIINILSICIFLYCIINFDEFIKRCEDEFIKK